VLLRSRGLSVLEAASGEAALELAHRHGGPIDLLVTDLRMPGMGGKVLAERLCARQPALKVLYVSGYTDHDVQELTRCGASESHFLSKPFTPGELRKVLERILAD
jgi:CheY-like chemotaxis protein